jgi:hypothetical protein
MKNSTAIWKDLTSWFGSSGVVTVANAYTRNGLIGGHAYSVLGIYTVTGDYNGTSQTF